MDLQGARALLNSRFLPAPILLGGHALRVLADSSDPLSVDILVATLDHRWPLLAKRAALSLRKLSDPSRIRRLWRLWADSRDPRLGEILVASDYETDADELLHLCALKLGRVEGMPISRDVGLAVAGFTNDPDLAVAQASQRYLERLRHSDPEAAVVVALAQGWFSRLGASRETIRMVLERSADDNLADAVRRFIRQLPPAEKVFAALCQGRVPACTDQDPPWSLLDFLDDTEAILRERAEAVLDRLRTLAPLAWLTLMLKAGREMELGWHPARVRQVLLLCEHNQPDVRAAVARYLQQAPANPTIDEIGYATWLRTNQDSLLELLEASGRQPPSPALRALVYLLQQRLDEYLALNDADGDLLRESWLLASADQRRRLGAVVVHSRDENLIQAYRQAMRASVEYDLNLHIQALVNAGLDEKLFELLPQMNLEHVLAVCRRWLRGTWRPIGKKDLDFVLELLNEYRTLIQVPPGRPSPSPPGTRDVLTAWLADGLAPNLIPQFCSSPNPVQRARGCLAGAAGQVPGHSAEPHARSAHWLERICAALSATSSDLLWQDSVIWVRLAAGGLPMFRELSANPSPDAFQGTLALLACLEGMPGLIPARLAALVRLMQVLHRRFCTGIEVAAVDVSATVTITDAPLELFTQPEPGG